VATAGKAAREPPALFDWKQDHVEASQADPIARQGTTGTEAKVTVFMCANCARTAPGADPARICDPRLDVPKIPWIGAVQEVMVPCTGRLQPEHLLRAFEAGADLVGVVACAQDNCHYLEGSSRAARRSAFVGALLDQIGLGARRLMLFHLPGSAREDMAAGASDMFSRGSESAECRVSAGSTARVCADSDPRLNEELSGRIQGIAAQVAERLQQLKPNPLRARAVQAEEPALAEAAAGEETEDNDE
jgi:F420-non-reducing hydrogenase iron-sulfur subunit